MNTITCTVIKVECQMRFPALLCRLAGRTIHSMTQRIRTSQPSARTLLYGVFLLAAAPGHLWADPSPAAIAAFNSYVGNLEGRLAEQHRSTAAFVSSVTPETEARLRNGELMIESSTPPGGAELDGALLHDWRGSAFAPGATAADFERLMRDFNAYPQRFAPQVLAARTVTEQGDHLQAWIRVRQHHILTVVMDSDYDITFGRLDPRHGYSISRSTRIAEIDSLGSANQKTLSSSEEHGFLWRLYTYWSYEERDGGLYMQIESVSLSRAIPTGLGWAVRPFVASVPRESLEFTLRSACNALRR